MAGLIMAVVAIAVALMGLHALRSYDEVAHAMLNKALQVLATEGQSEVGQLRARLDAEYDDRLQELIGTLVLGLALGFAAAAHMVSRHVVRPLAAIAATMRRLADGDLAVELPYAGRGDEIGVMADSVLVFKTNAADAQSLRQSQEDSRRQAERDKVAALQAMANTVEQESRQAVERVAAETGRMAGNATEMAKSAEVVGTNSESVAAAANQALSNAQSVADASERLSASIGEISRQVATASGITSHAVTAAEGAEETIHRLAQSVGRIGEVTQIINDIASQTNLLALNATIEAARAGEAGKGFAVVASEVKNLATQTARATEEISSQINEIQATTQNAVQAVQGIATAIRDVEGISSSIASAIDEQGAATGQITRNVSQTTGAAQEVSSRIAVVSKEAATNSERARQLEEMAAQVAKSVDELRNNLVRVVRTATQEVDRRSRDRVERRPA